MTRFSDGKVVDGKLVETNVREIPQEKLLACPHCILVAKHYREDGSCRCDDRRHVEMREWGYTWKDGRWQ